MAGSASAAAGSIDNLAAAHRALLADRSLQFQMTPYAPPPPPTWLRPLADFLQAVGPYLQYVFWAGVALVVLLVLYALWGYVREYVERRKLIAKPPSAAASLPEFRPAKARARSTLEEADRLAREGRYGEAAHVLLFRSIEDIEAAHPRLIGPSLTSREIERVPVLSAQGRMVFVNIARTVEANLFGGGAVSAQQYDECRTAYASFALGGVAV